MTVKTKTPRSAARAAPRLVVAFDAGKSGRRLRSVPTAQTAINTQIRTYGRTVLARSRYLAANNPYASAAKEAFVSALVGSGIKPSPLTQDAALKAELQQVFLDWTDEADADWLTDFYGLQSLIAAEMFEAGECFVRFRTRRPEDALTVPLQLQVLPAEMLPIDKSEDISSNRRIECGIEFDGIGRRTAYHFLRRHPGESILGLGGVGNTETVAVPADEVLHLYRPIRAGQIRGLPHTLSAIVKLAIMDQYDDAELERKRSAALFAAFVKRPIIDTGESPLQPAGTTTNGGRTEEGLSKPESSWALEPGATIDLEPGEEIQFATPADVGPNYEAFQYRSLLSVAAGFGVPYAAMTGDLRQTSYGSIRAGLVEFRRRVEAMQHHVMVYQFCRPVWRRWLDEAVLDGALSLSPAAFVTRLKEVRRVKWITPKWEWVDPLKDLQAELLAVENGFKARSDVIEAIGDDREATDARIKADQDSEEDNDLDLGPRSGGSGPAPVAATVEEEDADGNPPPPVPPEGEDEE
jgi:lambda family phage portal protein